MITIRSSDGTKRVQVSTSDDAAFREALGADEITLHPQEDEPLMEELKGKQDLVLVLVEETRTSGRQTLPSESNDYYDETIAILNGDTAERMFAVTLDELPEAIDSTVEPNNRIVKSLLSKRWWIEIRKKMNEHE